MSFDLNALWQLLRDTIEEWQRDHIGRLAAALSYYTIFSLAPLLVIALAVTSLFFSRSQAQEQLLEQVTALLGSGVDTAVLRDMIQAANITGDSSILATLIGLGVLLYGATNFFFQLERALNDIWDVPPPERKGIMTMLRKRAVSFVFVLGVGVLLIASLIANSVLIGISDYLNQQIAGIGSALQALNLLISLTVITGIFAVIFKFLPDKDIRWSDVWLGAALTAILFVLGQVLIGLYISNSSIASAYGAAGTLAVLLIWISYSMQILLGGAEFTHLYTKSYGSLS